MEESKTESTQTKATEEDLGKKVEEKIEEVAEEFGKEVEKGTDKFGCSYFAEGFFGAFFTVLGTVLIVVFWDEIALFNDDFSKMMDIIYISTVVNVGMYLVLMVMRSRWIKMFRDLVSNILALAFFVILLNVYPFAFGGSWDILEHVMKPMIYIFMFLVVLGTVVETAKNLLKLTEAT